MVVCTQEYQNGHSAEVYCVVFSPRGDTFFSGSLDETIRMWRLHADGGRPDGDFVRVFKGHDDGVLSVALTPDGKWLMSGSKDGDVQFWDPETGVAQLMLQGHKSAGEFSSLLPVFASVASY